MQYLNNAQEETGDFSNCYRISPDLRLLLRPFQQVEGEIHDPDIANYHTLMEKTGLNQIEDESSP
jgi:hypothetical protein